MVNLAYRRVVLERIASLVNPLTGTTSSRRRGSLPNTATTAAAAAVAAEGTCGEDQDGEGLVQRLPTAWAKDEQPKEVCGWGVCV